MEEENKILNYHGLDYFLSKLKNFFIIKPKTGNINQVLTLSGPDKITWENIPELELEPATEEKLGGVKSLSLDTDGIIKKVLVDNEGKMTVKVPDLQINEVSASIVNIPAVKNELIYSDDGNSLTCHLLMYSEGLVVDNAEDLQKCKEGADVSMSKVLSNWVTYGYRYTGYQDWGYCDSTSYPNEQTVQLESGTTTTVETYQYDKSPEGFIFNITNTTYLTGYYSDKLFSEYTSTIAAGVTKKHLSAGALDYMAILPAINVETSENITSGDAIALFINNTNNTGSLSRINVSGNHTISLIAWTQDNLNSKISDYNSSGATNIELITNAEGLSIVPFISEFENGTSKGTNSPSVILTKIIRKDNIFTIYVSSPYATSDNDYNHRNDLYYSRPITINLDTYIVTYIDLTGEEHTKNFTSDTTVVSIFNKLKGSARRGYETLSNPGTFFRNVTSDELILDVTPGENKVYKYNGSSWDVLSTTPLQLLKNGSRIAWNRITDKLFYNNGAEIYRIAATDIPGKKNLKIYALNIKDDAPTLILVFNANESLVDKSLIIKTGIGLTMQSYPQTNTMTISLESNHTIIKDNKIITNGHGSKGEELHDFTVKCNLNGSTLRVCPINLKFGEYWQFGNISLYTQDQKTFTATKSTSEILYMGLLGFKNVSGLGLGKLTITNNLGKVEEHYIGYIEDTFNYSPEKTITPKDGTICLVTTCSWNIICRYSSIYPITPSNDRIYCYLEIPADFIGTITFAPIKVSALPSTFNNGAVYCFTTSPNTSDYIDYNWEDSSLASDTELLLESSPNRGNSIEDLPSGLMNTPVGKYFVDIMYDFPEPLVVGNYVSDNLVNDCIIHDLVKKVNSLLLQISSI